MAVTRVAFFTYSPVESAQELYRFISPLKAAGIELVQGVVDGEVRPERIAAVDLVCFQRDFSRHFKAYQDLLTEAHACGVPVVLDLDDNLLMLPPDHPDRLAGDFADSLPALLHALLSADALTFTTTVLKQALGAFNQNIVVLPNYLDADLWQFRRPVLRAQDAPINILFMGTPTHIPDLNGISEALRGTARRFGYKVRFTFFGAQPPEGLADIAQVAYHPVRSFDYRQFQQEFRQLEADIALAPLQDNLFNRCKSAIKFMEYSALGLPGVYAALPPYAAAVQDGVNGFLAGDAQAWENKLGALIEGPGLCLQMAENAQEDIRRKWLAQDHAAEWSKAYNEIARAGAKQAAEASPIEAALAAAALQLDELRDLTNSRYSRLHEDLAKQNDEILQRGQQIEALRDEAVGYANSRSWKLTRPLRAFNRFLARLMKR